MTPGVPWHQQNLSSPPQQAPERLLAIAREAARQLVDELQRARQYTREWTDEALTDSLVDAAISQCLYRLAKTGCWGETNRLPSNEFWNIAGPVLELGVLQHRARFKPRGYAGDYQMLHWICTDYRCDHPLGRAFDRYFQHQAAPQAVRSRVRQTASAIVARCLPTHAAHWHVVSVGSGAADDIHQAMTLLPPECRSTLRVTLLDLDPEALDFARQRLGPLLPAGAIDCIRENLFRLPQKPGGDKILGSPDFLVCSGLFDYLDDPATTAMLRQFWQRLAHGGLLLAGNFAPHNPTRAYMEWIGNWYLNYRTAEDLQRLAMLAGIPKDAFSIGSEALGVDLFLTAEKAAA